MGDVDHLLSHVSGDDRRVGIQRGSCLALLLDIFHHRRGIHDIFADQGSQRWLGPVRYHCSFPCNHTLMDIWPKQEDTI